MKIILINIAIFFASICQAQSPQLMISKGHADDVRATATSLDGKLLASGSTDKSVIVWDVLSSKELIAIKGFSSWVKTVALSPDGSRVFSGSSKEMRINDLQNNGRELLRVPFYGEVLSIALSKDGNEAAAVSRGASGTDNAPTYELKLFNTASAKLIKTITGSGLPMKVMYDINGELLLLTGKNIQRININSGTSSTIENYSLNDLDLMSPDGKYVIITGFEREDYPDEDFNTINSATNPRKGTATITVFDRRSQQIVKVFKGGNNSIKDFVFTPDSHYLLAVAGGAIYMYDFVKMKYDSKFVDKIWSPDGLSFTADGKTLICGSADKKVRIFNFKTKELDQTLGGEANVIRDIAINPDGKSIAFIGSTEYYSGTLNVLDLQRGTLAAQNYTDEMFPKIEYSSNGKYLFAARFGKGLKLWDAAHPESEGSFITPDKSTMIAVSPDNKYLLSTNKDAALKSIAVYSMSDGQFLKSVGVPATVYDMKFSPDSKSFYIATTGSQDIYRANIETGYIDKTYKATTPNKNRWAERIELNKDGTQMLVGESFGGSRWYNTVTGVASEDKFMHGGGMNDAVLLPGTNQIITCGGEAAFPDSTIKFSDFTTRKVVKTLYVSGTSPTAMSTSKSGKFLFTATFDKRVLIWDISKSKIIATLVFFGEGDWVIADESGRFDGSQGGMKKMYYVKNLQIVPLESSYEKFFTPGLLPSLLAGDVIPAPPIDVNKMKSPPIVKIDYTEGGRNLEVEDDNASYNTTNGEAKIQVNAACLSDAVTEIRLYQNGKLVQGTRNLVVEDDVASSPQMNKTFTVVLVPGQNVFKAIALNTQRSESTPVSLSVKYTAAKKDIVTNTNITLHMLVVGINKYKNPKYNLNYAQADAEAFKKAMAGGSSSLFSSSQITYLSNEEATQDGMKAAFQKIKANALPQDLFIFYYAGHGVVNDQKEFFLAPYDVTQLYGSDNALAQKGFSAAALQQWSKEIKAQKQLFILDACQSAGALTQMGVTRGAAEEKAIAQLARSTGTQWLTASGSQQLAAEFDDLGHGSFTYCILQALSGAANTGNQITVKQLDAYLQEKVPEITAKYKGAPQYPASYSYGNDFPIFIFK